jgi:hypothetical protein
VTDTTARNPGRTSAPGLASLLAGLLWLQLPSAAAGVSHGAGVLATLEQGAPGVRRTSAALLAQAAAAANPGIPKEVKGWLEGAKAAAAKGDSAEALRLQKLVVAWLQANRPDLDVIRAGAFIILGNLLSDVGQIQEALAPTEEAVKNLRQLEGSDPESLWLYPFRGRDSSRLTSALLNP